MSLSLSLSTQRQTTTTPISLSGSEYFFHFYYKTEFFYFEPIFLLFVLSLALEIEKKISHQSEFCLKFFLLKEIDFLFPKNKNRPKVLIYLFIFKTNKRLSLVCVFLHIFKSYLEQIFFLSACFLPNTMEKNTLSFWVFNI